MTSGTGYFSVMKPAKHYTDCAVTNNWTIENIRIKNRNVLQ